MTTETVRPVHTMDRLLLGDNQFFGINHMSEERARAQAMYRPSDNHRQTGRNSA